MIKQLMKRLCPLAAVAVVLSGCVANEKPPAIPVAVNDTDRPENRPVEGLPFDFQVNPENFQLSLQVEDSAVTVSEAIEKQSVEDYREEMGGVSWRYPQKQIQVALTPTEDYLKVEIRSEAEKDNTFVWPNISAERYFMPLGQGKQIPSQDPLWKGYLEGRQLSVMEQFSMPFWVSSAGEYALLFIMENPYRSQLEFSANPDISFAVSHEYPQISENKTNSYRIYVTDKDPVKAAKLYRNYVIEKGGFVTLEQKARKNPNVEKLYGAPFVYLWGDLVVSQGDVDWPAFRQSTEEPVMEYLRSFSRRIEGGEEFENALDEIKAQDYVAEYQKNIICNYISLMLREEGFWNPQVFTGSSDTLDHLLERGYENLSASEKIQVHKYALAANMPEVFHDAGGWMEEDTLQLLEEMKEGGIDRLWIGLNSWEQAYAKPELVEQARKLDYLIASYDSYHSIHEPGKEEWITAEFEDDSLYDRATVTDKKGEKVGGFQNVGRKLNPALSLPSVKKRMEGIMSNQLPFNSWFIDCDAAGEIYDDYTPGHITTQEEDLKARLERMSYIRDNYDFVIGSEGGNDFSASTIAFAHGIELKSFSWMDQDMKKNRDSVFYMGNYYNPKGGVPQRFSKRIPLKELYYGVFVDPRYDIPLFKLVYNDSLITSYHWDWSTFKIQGATKDRMIREVLYNVPPLYHLDYAQWQEYGEEILNHHSVWSRFSREAVTREMTDFKYLEKDGSVQKTVYGEELTAVANYGDKAYEYEGAQIPPHSIWIHDGEGQTIYTPPLQEDHS